MAGGDDEPPHALSTTARTATVSPPRSTGRRAEWRSGRARPTPSLRCISALSASRYRGSTISGQPSHFPKVLTCAAAGPTPPLGPAAGNQKSVGTAPTMLDTDTLRP